MSNLEHYFENLLFEGLDYEDKINKSQLTAEQIDAVETCATYITYTFFCGKDELKKYINGEIDVVKTGKWIDKPDPYYRWQTWCSCCGQHSGIGGIKSNRHKPYCPNCGAKMAE